MAMCAMLAPAALAADHAVNLTTSKTFSPAAVTVAPGDTVTWHWAGDRQHNVTADSGQAETFSSANKTTGTFVKSFTTVGHYTYRCTLHSGMTGAVNVATPTSTPDTTPPTAPTGVVATATDATVTIDWADSGSVDLANYVVQRRVGTGAWSTVGSPTSSVLTDTTVTNGVTYSYSVTAVDTSANASAASAVVTATPVAPPPPPPTTGPADRHVAIASYAFGPATITVNAGDAVTWDWTGPDVNHSVTATAGQPEAFDSHAGLPDNQIAGAPAGGFSHTFAQVGTFTYYCRVHTDMIGTVKVVTPPATPDTTPPDAPAAPVAAATDASVTVDWPDSAAPDVANYVVERQAGAGAWTTVAQPVASIFIDTSVAAGTTYAYRVTAVDVAGNHSSASIVASATPAALATQADVGPITRHVSVAGYQYAPALMTVNSGDTVEWDWDGTDVNHSVSSLDGLAESFDSHLGALVTAIVGPPPGGAYSHLFTQVGDFPYLCKVHPDMTGTVRVVASGAPDTQPANPPAALRTPAPAPAANVTPARTAKTHAVKIADFAFAPGNVSIAVGDVVKWSWTGKDTNHSVTSTPGQAESYESHPGLKTSEVTKAPAGGSFSHTFTHEGTFTYLCRVHPDMKGKVTVGPAPLRVRIVSVKRAGGSLRVSYRLTQASAVKAQVFRGAKRILTKSARGRSGANTLRIVLPRSARRAALKVVLRAGPAGKVLARAAVRALRR
jgi:plastocyanin